MSRNKVTGDFGLKHEARLKRSDFAFALLAALLVACALSAALTAWFAHGLGYRDVLGSPWFALHEVPIYPPWGWLEWRTTIAAHYPASPWVVRTESAGQGIVALALAAGVLALAKRRERRLNRINQLHGSAHWATPDEVRRTGLLDQKAGVFLADWYDPRTRDLRYLRHGGATHSLVIGPTRCGKDVGNVVPTALAEPESMVVLDPKGDIYKLTSGARMKRGHRVLRLELAAPPHLTARTNPIERIRLGTYREIPDAQLLAGSWFNGDGAGFSGNNEIFAKAARPLLAACFLHVLYREQQLGRPPASLEHVAQEFLSSSCPYDSVLEEWRSFPHDPELKRGWLLPDGTRTPTHPMIAAVANNELTCVDKKLKENVRFAIRSALELLHDTTLVANLSASDFGVEDLVNGDRPTSLYLVYPPAERKRLAPVLRILLEQMVYRLTEEMDVRDGKPAKPHKYGLHLLLNEFTAIGRMEAIEAALPICASFGIRATIFVQNLGQLRETYGQHEQISRQCALRVIYPPDTYEDAEGLSKALGKYTASKRSQRSGGLGGGARDDESETARDLITPDELMRMARPERYIDAQGEERIKKAGNVVVSKAGHAPIYTDQILFWQDPVMAELASLPPAPSSPFVVRPARRARPLAAPAASHQEAEGAAPNEDDAPDEVQAPNMPPPTDTDAQPDANLEEELAWLAARKDEESL